MTTRKKSWLDECDEDEAVAEALAEIMAIARRV
jgi:hypothetical protein